MTTDSTVMDLDSRCNCSTCKTRMSSLLHDSHLICVARCGRDCNLDNRCVECEGWSEEVMIKYVRYCKSLDSKSKAKKEKRTSASSDQASLPSSRDSNMSQASAASAGVSEARVAELIAQQLVQFSSSFAASMHALFDIKTFIDDRFVRDSQLEPNPSSGFWFFSALLHWLKELGFEVLDPGLFGQLVQEVSGSLVTAANSASGLAAFMLAKRREGVLSYFPSHVGAHFKKDLAASSFSGPRL